MMRQAFLGPALLAASFAIASPAWPQAAALRATVAPTPAPAEPDLAYGAYQRGLYLTALHLATKRLDGDPDDAVAKTLIGELHNQGLGVRSDPVKAAEWYRLAARGGDAYALSALGLMAMDGRGMPKDVAQGRAWLELAAAKGEASSSYNLALLLLSSGAPEHLARATGLLRVAAEAEVADAQHALGVLHLLGRGLQRDTGEAARWFRRAADNGHTAGEVEYAILLFNGDGAKADETRAARYFWRAAAKGNAIAQNRLARLYAAGRGVAQNAVEAAAWHLAAASRGLADPWLDQALKSLPDDQRLKAERLAAGRIGAL